MDTRNSSTVTRLALLSSPSGTKASKSPTTFPIPKFSLRKSSKESDTRGLRVTCDILVERLRGRYSRGGEVAFLVPGKEFAAEPLGGHFVSEFFLQGLLVHLCAGRRHLDTHAGVVFVIDDFLRPGFYACLACNDVAEEMDLVPRR